MNRIEEQYNKGLIELLEYFKNPKNHLDKDILHVSKDELYHAKKNVSIEASKFIEALLNNNAENYLCLSLLQREGFINDRQVSMRDIYTARNRISFHGEALGLKYTNFHHKITAVISNIEKDTNLYNDVINNAIELHEEKTFFLTLNLATSSVAFNPILKKFVIKNSVSTNEICVSESLFNKCNVSENIPDDYEIKFLININNYSSVSVNSKYSISHYFYIDKTGKSKEIKKEIYEKALTLLQEEKTIKNIMSSVTENKTVLSYIKVK